MTAQDAQDSIITNEHLNQLGADFRAKAIDAAQNVPEAEGLPSRSRLTISYRCRSDAGVQIESIKLGDDILGTLGFVDNDELYEHTWVEDLIAANFTNFDNEEGSIGNIMVDLDHGNVRIEHSDISQDSETKVATGVVEQEYLVDVGGIYAIPLSTVQAMRAALLERGVRAIALDYSGCGDSGEEESTTFYGPDNAVINDLRYESTFPIYKQFSSWGKQAAEDEGVLLPTPPGPEQQRWKLEEMQLLDLAAEVLRAIGGNRHNGYETNEGGRECITLQLENGLSYNHEMTDYFLTTKQTTRAADGFLPPPEAMPAPRERSAAPRG